MAERGAGPTRAPSTGHLTVETRHRRFDVAILISVGIWEFGTRTDHIQLRESLRPLSHYTKRRRLGGSVLGNYTVPVDTYPTEYGGQLLYCTSWGWEAPFTQGPIPRSTGLHKHQATTVRGNIFPAPINLQYPSAEQQGTRWIQGQKTGLVWSWRPCPHGSNLTFSFDLGFGDKQML